jgi:hypothetical protein
MTSGFGCEGVEDCVTECDNRGRGCIEQWDVYKYVHAKNVEHFLSQRT